MAKTYHPKYYAEPVKGSGHIYINPKTGQEKPCKGVAWYIDFKTIDGKRDRKKVHGGLCTCPPRQKGACPHERIAQEALAAVLNAPAPIELTLAEAAKDRSIVGFAARHLHKVEQGTKHCERNKLNVRLSAEAVQQHLGISQDTLYRLIADRGLPATKIGGRWKFKLSMVDAWAVAGGASEPNEDETPGGKK